MKVTGLKVLQDKGWKAASTFQTEKGDTLNIPAAHKVLCEDENGETCQVQVITEKPLNFKVGAELPAMTLASKVSRDSWSWSLKLKL